MDGHFKNALIGFKQGMRFKTLLGWREVLAIRDGIAICWPVGGKAPDFMREYKEPTETMLLDLDRPWVGRQYRNSGGDVYEVMCMTDSAVFIQLVSPKVQHAIPWDRFKRDFAPVLLEQPFKAGDWALWDGKLVVIEELKDGEIALVEEVGSRIEYSVPVDSLRHTNRTQEQPVLGDAPACVQWYKGQQVVVLGTWGGWSWVIGTQSCWKPFVVKTSDITQ